jgi:hypothetical protein
VTRWVLITNTAQHKLQRRVYNYIIGSTYVTTFQRIDYKYPASEQSVVLINQWQRWLWRVRNTCKPKSGFRGTVNSGKTNTGPRLQRLHEDVRCIAIIIHNQGSEVITLKNLFLALKYAHKNINISAINSTKNWKICKIKFSKNFFKHEI